MIFLGCNNLRATTLIKKSCFYLLFSTILSTGIPPAYAAQLDFSNLGTDRLDNGDANGVNATMTYESVAVDNGITLDLIVTTLSDYSANTSKNGNINTASPSGDGRINITAGTSTNFRFSLVNAADDTPYVVDSFELGLFDLDGNNNGAGTNPRQEKVTLYTAVQYTVTDPNNFESIIISDDKAEFLSQDLPVSLPTDSSQLLSLADDPNNPQERHAVNFLFNSVSEVELNFESIGGNSTRNFYFGGDIAFDETTETVTFEPVPFEFSPSLGLLLSGASLLGVKYVRKKILLSQ